MIKISLTTTSERLHIARYTLLSLLHQDIQPDQIALNISTEPYLKDKGINVLPDWLKEIDAHHLTVQYTENTGPYRKLLPTLHESTDDDIIITCDDDVIYGTDWLTKLIHTAHEYPSHIVCGRARRPTRNFLGRLQSYPHWISLTTEVSGHDLIPIGVSGVAYRPNLLDQDFISDKAFMDLAPRQDDLWFKEASSRKGTPVMITGDVDDTVHVIKTKSALSDDNASGSFASTWGTSTLHPFLERAVFRIKAYLGFVTCDNDKVWEAIRRYSQS